MLLSSRRWPRPALLDRAELGMRSISKVKHHGFDYRFLARAQIWQCLETCGIITSEGRDTATQHLVAGARDAKLNILKCIGCPHDN